MKICLNHWDELRKAIEVRGLFPFVAKSGEVAIKAAEDDLRGTTDTARPYDPLMNANMQIWSQGLERGGLYMMTGDLCPLCELEKHTPSRAAAWIGPCCDAILNDFQEKGWIQKPC